MAKHLRREIGGDDRRDAPVEHACPGAGAGSDLEPGTVEWNVTSIECVADRSRLGVVDRSLRPLGGEAVEEIGHPIGMLRRPPFAECDRSCQHANRMVRPGERLGIAGRRMIGKVVEHASSLAEDVAVPRRRGRSCPDRVRWPSERGSRGSRERGECDRGRVTDVERVDARGDGNAHASRRLRDRVRSEAGPLSAE